jgi:hypothetical protein
MNPVLKSVLFKALYGVVAALAAAMLSWVQVNPDPAAWTLLSLKFALLTALAASVKKIVAGMFA